LWVRANGWTRSSSRWPRGKFVRQFLVRLLYRKIPRQLGFSGAVSSRKLRGYKKSQGSYTLAQCTRRIASLRVYVVHKSVREAGFGIEEAVFIGGLGEHCSARGEKVTFYASYRTQRNGRKREWDRTEYLPSSSIASEVLLLRISPVHS
jgi:hypothetical protein